MYTLKDRREAASSLRTEWKSRVKTEAEVVKRAAEDNEVRINAVARRDVLRQERKSWGCRLVNRLEAVVQVRSDSCAFNEKQSEIIEEFEAGFAEIRR